MHGDCPRGLALPPDAPDVMPTLLGLCGAPVLTEVEGRDWSPYFREELSPTGEEEAVLSMHAEYTEIRQYGMRVYRGLRSLRHAYVRNLGGPWLLYDNENDPFQMDNLIGDTDHQAVQREMESRLQRRLDRLGDEFIDGWAYLERDNLTHYGKCI